MDIQILLARARTQVIFLQNELFTTSALYYASLNHALSTVSCHLINGFRNVLKGQEVSFIILKSYTLLQINQLVSALNTHATYSQCSEPYPQRNDVKTEIYHYSSLKGHRSSKKLIPWKAKSSYLFILRFCKAQNICCPWIFWLQPFSFHLPTLWTFCWLHNPFQEVSWLVLLIFYLTFKPLELYATLS